MGATAVDAVLPVQANTRDDPMAYRAAGELAEALARRRVSSRELVESAISRIEALDSKINAVVVRDFDRAQAAAADADRLGGLEAFSRPFAVTRANRRVRAVAIPYRDRLSWGWSGPSPGSHGPYSLL
jgi:hypothetical protein